MGFFGFWLVAKGVSDERLRDLGLEPRGQGGAEGWTFADGPRHSSDDMDDLVARASAGGGAAVGAYVYDSDAGWVFAAADGGLVAHVVVNPESAAELGSADAGDPAGFARWSAAAPQPASVESVEEVLAEQWVFAEEGVAELLERIGLPAPFDPAMQVYPMTGVVPIGGEPFVPPPSPPAPAVGAEGLGGYGGPLGTMSESVLLGSVPVPWRETRFVPGIAPDGIGIWDREQPDGPIATFPATSRGSSRLHEELRRLQEPIVAELLELTGLGGFVRPSQLETGIVQLVDRLLPTRDARFVVAEGDGFVGVWDREHPAKPIERFSLDDDGRSDAESRAHGLLFDQQLGTKVVPGERWYLHATPATSVPSPWQVPESLRERLAASLPPEWLESSGAGSVEEFIGSIESGTRSHLPARSWLLLEEGPDDGWQPAWHGTESGGWYLYEVPTGGARSLNCRGSFRAAEEARRHAERLQASGDWLRVPDEVPRTLLETVRWAALLEPAPN